MLIMPISGIAMSQLSGRTVKVFDWFAVPNFISINKPLAKQIYGLHVWSSYIIIGLVVVHILAAFYHHFIQKDDVLKRMSPL